jgi:hypothetical protein
MPEGVQVTSPPPKEYKGIDVDVSVNIEIAIDVYKISKLVVVAWLAKKLLSQSGSHKIIIDGRQITIDQSKIEEELQKAIDYEKSDDNK